MDRKHISAIRAFFISLLIFTMICGAVGLAESRDTGEKFILRFEGKVLIEDVEGGVRFAETGMTFGSGESVTTGLSTRAQIQLDETKILTLDAESKAKIDKQGSAMTLYLPDGFLLLDVQKKLDENETLDIKTSTTTVSIRGTILGVSVETLPAAQTEISASAANQSIGQAGSPVSSSKYTARSLMHATGLDSLLNGSKSKGGMRSGADLSALGYLLMLNGYSEAQADELLKFENGTYPHWDEVSKILYAKYPSGLLINLSDMYLHIPEDIGDDQPKIGAAVQPRAAADAQTQAPATLQRTTVLVLEGTAQLSYTDEQGATHSLPVSAGEKVTLVDQNGNDLVDLQSETSKIAADDLKGFLKETITRDPETYKRISDATDNLLPTVAFFTGSAEKAYDGKALTDQTIKVTALPTDCSYSCETVGSQTNVGQSENILSSIIIYNLSGEDVTGTFKDIAVYPGTLMVTPASLSVTTGSATKMYDGTPLTSPDVTVTGLADNETIAVTATGTVTDVGATQNTYIVDWGEVKKENYSITESLGTLEITPNDTSIWFTAASDEKVYDGTALTNGNVRVSGLPAGFAYRTAASGSQLNAGSSANKVSACKIFDQDGTNVIGYFSDISYKDGTLTVVPLKVEIDLSGVEVDAYGNITSLNPVLTYLNGTHAGEKEYGSRMMSMIYAYSLFTGDSVRLTISAKETENNKYKLIAQAECSGSEYGNIEITYAGNTEISGKKLNELVITTASASKLYDGTPLTSPEVTVTGLEDGDSITVTATGSITEIGTAENTYAIAWGDTDPDKYTVTEQLGTLEITGDDTEITITAGSREKRYDGAEMTDSSFSVSGLPAGFTCEAVVNGTQKNVGQSDNVIASYKILDENGADLTARFTNVNTVNGKLKVTPRGLDVQVYGYDTTYNGSPVAPEAMECSFPGGLLECVNDEVIYDASGRAVGLACTFRLIDGGTLKITCMGESDVGSHTYKPELVYTGTLSDNYTVMYTGLSYSIEPMTVGLVLNGGKDSVPYDGAFHGGALSVMCEEYGYFSCSSEGDSNWKLTGENGEVITVHIGGGGTDIGTYTLSSTYNIISGQSSNYDIVVSGTSFEIVQNSAPVTLTAGSASKPYDGTPLTAGEFTVAGLPDGLTVTATCKGSQTDVGESDNVIDSYAIMNGTTDVSENFTAVSTVAGTLIVTENKTPITLTPKDCKKVYDGTPLTGSEAVAEGLPGGFTYTFTLTGSMTAAGTSDVTIESYTILNASSEDVTSFFANITTGTGTLTIDELQIELDLGGMTRQYNGAYGDGLTPGLKLLNGNNGGTVISPSSVNQYPGGCNASFTLPTGDNVALTVSGYTSCDAGTYTLTGSWNISGNASSYSVSTTNDKVIIEPAPITVSCESVSERKAYDGYPLPQNTDPPIIIGTVYDDIYVEKAGDTITDVGQIPLKAQIYWNGVNPDNYAVTMIDGTLEITKAKLKITSHDGSKEYDGEPLTVKECDKEGLAYGEDVTINYTGSRTEPGSSPNTFTVTWDNANEGNYDLTTVFGTLTVTEAAITPGGG